MRAVVDMVRSVRLTYISVFCYQSRADGTMPAGWGWERFRAVPLGNNEIGLWSLTWKRFVRMHKSNYIDRSGVVTSGAFPKGWQWEKFRVVCVSGCAGPMPIGARLCPLCI